jgi:hypothetical protein
MLFSKPLALIPLTLLVLFQSLAFGITIDPFTTDQSTNSSLPISTSAAEALGGNRKILAVKSSGALGKVTASSFFDSSPGVNNGAYFHSQDAGISGESTITWDGTSSGSFNAFGLSGLNLKEDGSTAFLVNILDFNAASSGDVKLTFSAYYGSDIASMTLVISSPGVLTFPFSSFLLPGGNLFDFTKVGALTMKVVGGSAADLTLDFVKTNGKCDLIPLSSAQVIVDQCGQCGGDNSSCKDCAGAINGTAVLDRCGVCAGDGNSCLGCEVESSGELSTALDQAAKVQEQAIRLVINQLNRQFGNKIAGLKKKTAQYAAEAHRLQIRNWTVSWFIPPTTILCSNQTLCVKNEVNINTIEEYRTHAAELLQINKQVVSLYLKYSKKKSAANAFLKRGQQSYANAMAFASQIPRGQDICS